eukprot:scaffold79875_cov23-Tisochrysis_lutea.AAC.1
MPLRKKTPSSRRRMRSHRNAALLSPLAGVDTSPSSVVSLSLLFSLSPWRADASPLHVRARERQTGRAGEGGGREREDGSEGGRGGERGAHDAAAGHVFAAAASPRGRATIAPCDARGHSRS